MKVRTAGVTTDDQFCLVMENTAMRVLQTGVAPLFPWSHMSASAEAETPAPLSSSFPSRDSKPNPRHLNPPSPSLSLSLELRTVGGADGGRRGARSEVGVLPLGARFHGFGSSVLPVALTQRVGWCSGC